MQYALFFGLGYNDYVSEHRSGPITVALETSGRIGSVAIGIGDRVLETASFSTSLRHAVELLPTLDRLCVRQGFRPDEIQRVFLSIGPGSFTGLRIGVTVSRTLAWSGNVALVAVPTLEVIAQNALEHVPTHDVVGVVLDAKRGHVFAGRFDRRGDRFVSTSAPAEWDPSEFVRSLPGNAGLMGEGIAYHRSALEAAGVGASKSLTMLPEELNRARAEVLYQLGLARAAMGAFSEPTTLTPHYIRRPEAEEVWERKHGMESKNA